MSSSEKSMETVRRQLEAAGFSYLAKILDQSMIDKLASFNALIQLQYVKTTELSPTQIRALRESLSQEFFVFSEFQQIFLDMIVGMSPQDIVKALDLMEPFFEEITLRMHRHLDIEVTAEKISSMEIGPSTEAIQPKGSDVQELTDSFLEDFLSQKERVLNETRQEWEKMYVQSVLNPYVTSQDLYQLEITVEALRRAENEQKQFNTQQLLDFRYED